MKYTELTKKALRISFDAHKEQYDKTGLPYIFHPFHLAEQFNEEDYICVALLHDVVEDTDITFKDLEKYGFNERIISALKLLTHSDDVDYMDYIGKIRDNEIARRVKIEDLKHNSDITRLDSVKEYDILRNNKYKKALEYLLK